MRVSGGPFIKSSLIKGIFFVCFSLLNLLRIFLIFLHLLVVLCNLLRNFFECFFLCVFLSKLCGRHKSHELLEKFGIVFYRYASKTASRVSIDLKKHRLRRCSPPIKLRKSAFTLSTLCVSLLLRQFRTYSPP